MGRVSRAQTISQRLRNRVWTLFLLALAVASVAVPVCAQNIAVSPATLQVDGRSFPSVLFRPQEAVHLTWSPAAPGMLLKIGDFPGEYHRLSLSVSNQESVSFTPESIGLAVGIYHAILTTVPEKQTIGEIRDAAEADPNALYSANFTFVVESPVAPVVVGPRGTVFTSTPTFSWDGIPGVPAYVVAVSSTPFEIRTDPATNDPVVEGLTPVWGALTSGTSAKYGQSSPDSPFPNLPAPPLVPGREYYFTVVNTYSKSDVSLLSAAFGGVVAFSYESFTGLLAPELSVPEDGQEFFEDPNILFEWQQVDEAASYTFTLTERQNIGGSIGDVPVFSITTPSTSLELAANRLMRRGRYTWQVIPNDASGSAGLASQRSLRYDAPMGGFRFRPVSSQDQTVLLGVRVVVENLDGGHAPIVPLVNTAASYADSLVVGRYRFNATREQFADTSVVVVVELDRLIEFDLKLRPLPARLSGRVQDDQGNPVENARVTIESEGLTRSLLTGSRGRFSFSVPPGIYRVTARRDGFASASTDGISVRASDQIDLPRPLEIRAIAGFVSGRVVNETGQSVQLATVIATSGEQEQSATTDSDGAYNFVLAAGNWLLSAEREGFLGARPQAVLVSRGDQISNVVVVLTERVSQLSGTVFGVETDAGGFSSRPVLAGAVVEAIPTSGPVRRTETEEGGAFVLDLGAGSYVVRALASGFLASPPITIRVGYSESVVGVELDLIEPEASLSGRVVDPLGRPVAGASVWVDEASGSAGPVFITGGNARFSFQVAPGSRTVFASAPGFEQASVNIGLASGDHFEGVSPVLVPNAATITGRIGRSGAPVPRAEILAESGDETASIPAADDGSYRLGLRAGTWSISARANGFAPSQPVQIIVQSGQQVSSVNFDLRLQQAFLGGVVTAEGAPIGAASVVITAGRAVTKTLTRTDGLFSVPVMPGLELSVSIERDGFVPQSVVLPPLGSQEERSLSIELASIGASVSGRVTDSGGVPLSGAVVSATQDDNLWEVETDFAGAFELALEPGAYEISGSRTGYEAETRQVILAIGERRTGVDYSLDERFGAALFMVVDQDDSGLPNATGRLTAEGLTRTARSDASGQLTFSRLPPGVYQIAVELEGYSAGTLPPLVLTPGGRLEERVNLTLEQGTLTGRTVTLAGSSVEGVLIRVGAEGLDKATLSGVDGSFSIEGLPAGSYSLEATMAGFERATLNEIGLSPASISVDIGLLPMVARSERLEGIVTDTGGSETLSGVTITLAGARGTQSTQTNELGAYSFEALSAGQYELTAAAAGFVVLQTDVSVPATAAFNFSLLPAQALIRGRVADRAGTALPFLVRVVASSGGLTVATTTDQTGAYTVSGLDSGLDWTIRTDITRPGYQNAENSVGWAIGATEAISNLAVSVETSSISGDVGVGRASVRLISLASGTIRGLTASRTDGSFSFRFLAAGTYRIAPEKPGVTFLPTSVDVVLQQGQSQTARFSAVSSVGSVTVITQNGLRQPIPGVDVVVASRDGLLVRTQRSSAAGRAEFDDLPLARSYTVRPSLPGFSANPASADIFPTRSDPIELVFTLARATGSIAGGIVDESGTPLQAGRAEAVHQETGVLYSSVLTGGTYLLEGLPAGSYKIVGIADGFRDNEVTVTLADGERAQAPDLILRLASVRLQGRVLYRGQGLQNVTVTVSSLQTLETTSDAAGFFSFNRLPLDHPAPDTSVYQVTIDAPVGRDVFRTVRIPGSLLGQVVTLDDIILPSGRLRVEVDDGLVAIRGATIVIERPRGGVVGGETDENGLFVSEASLAAGVHRIEVSRPGHLVPSGPELLPLVPEDTSTVSVRLALPYTHEPPVAVSTTLATTIQVFATDGYDASATTGTLRYQPVSGSAVVTTLIPTLRGLEAEIPPQLSTEEIRYEINLADPVLGFTFLSGPVSLQPVSPGTLASLRLDPPLDGSQLRVGESYSLRLVIRDGVGNGVEDQFGGAAGGTVTWTSSDPAVEIRLPDANDPTRVVLGVSEPGAFTLNAEVRLDAARITQVSSFEAGDFSPTEITLAVPGPLADNQSPGIQVTYVAKTENGKNQLLGSGLSWTVSPVSAGSVSPTGLFQPTDPSFIGPVVITVLDQLSGQSASVSLSLFRHLLSGASATLMGASGTRLVLPAGAIPFAADIGLSSPVLVGPKRNTIPFGRQSRYTVGDRLVRFTIRSDRALLNDSLHVPATLTLPEDASLALFEGERTIGRFDVSSLRWHLEATQGLGGSVSSSSISRLAEFGTLVRNQGLGLDHVAVLPNPFSPAVSPLRIGYLLTTNDPPARVSVRVFSIRGELIRTLISSESQQPGRYGSASSLREVLWDGLTDAGRQARNGRYIVEIRAVDSTGSTTETISVVLVK